MPETIVRKLPKMGNWLVALFMASLVLVLALGADILIKLGGHNDGLPEVAWLAVGNFQALIASQSERILSFYTGGGERKMKELFRLTKRNRGGIFYLLSAFALLTGLWCFFIAHSEAAQADDFVDPRVMAEIRDDCERETRPVHEVRGIPGLPGSGFLLDRASNGEARRERKARDELLACIDREGEAVRAEREREAEEVERAKLLRCQRECAPTDDWRDYCAAPGVPALPLCPATASEKVGTERKETKRSYALPSLSDGGFSKMTFGFAWLPVPEKYLHRQLGPCRLLGAEHSAWRCMDDIWIKDRTHRAVWLDNQWMWQQAQR